MYRVYVECIDTVMQQDLIVTLDWDYGDYVEMNEEWDGFGDVAAAINRHLADVDPAWIWRARALKPGEGGELACQ